MPGFEALQKKGLSWCPLFKAFSKSSPMRSHVANVCKIKAPPRVVVFGWLALLSKILTMDKLKQRRMIMVNVCPMCLWQGIS